MKLKLAGISLLALAFCSDAIAQEVVRNIDINGLKRVERETALSYAGINIGGQVSSDELNTALRRLYDTGLFSDVSFDTKGDTLVINVVENPVIGVRAFDGNNKIDDKILEAEIQSQPRSVLIRQKYNKMYKEYLMYIKEQDVMVLKLTLK